MGLLTQMYELTLPFHPFVHCETLWSEVLDTILKDTVKRLCVNTFVMDI